jgi:RNA polymerase sigma factor (TIGR02999 family)
MSPKCSERAQAGDPNAPEKLFSLVCDELRRLAAAKMAREAHGQTLQATALVHEAWLRLGGSSTALAKSAHFFGAAAEAMRRILIDAARRRARQSRVSVCSSALGPTGYRHIRR